MTARALAPRTGKLVNTDTLREAVRLLREAGDGGITRTQLAEGLGGCLRTVDRALRLLKDQGARLEALGAGPDGGGHRHLVLRRGPTWDESLTPQARTALRIALMALEQVGTEVWADHLDALERLADPHLSSRDRAIFATLSARVRVHGTVDDPARLPEDVLAPVLLALGHPGGPRQLELTYTPLGKPAWTRVVHPYVLTHDAFSGGAFLLVSDPDRPAPHHLRLSRIEAAKALSRPARFPDEAAMERAARYQIGGWVADRDPFPVTVDVCGASWCQALREAPPALPDVLVTRRREGGHDGVRVTFQATEPHAPARWILQFGPDAVVVGPEAVRTLVAKRLQEGAARYLP